MTQSTRWGRPLGSSRRTLKIASIATAACLSLAACSGGSGGTSEGDSADDGAGDSSAPGVTDSSVTLAYIGDLSGPDAGTERTFYLGVKAAIDVANENGGVAGREIELAAGDTKFDTAQAITEFKKYTSDEPALGIVGIHVSSMFEALDSRIKAEQIPVVGPVGVTQLTLDNPYVYQAQAGLPIMAEAITQFMSADQGEGLDVGVATISTASGDEWFELFSETAESVGSAVTGHQKMDPAAVEAAAQVAQFKKDGADAVTLHSGGGGGIALVKSMGSGDLDVPVYSTSGANGPALWEAAGALAPQVYAFDAFAPPDSDVEGREALEAAMTANGDWDEYKDEKNYAQGWVTGNVIVEALDQAGEDLTRASYIEALRSPDGYDTGGYSAPINWSESNGIEDPSAVKVFTFDPAEGRIVEVQPR